MKWQKRTEMLLLNRTVKSERESHSVVSDSVQPRERYGENPWDSLGQNAGVGSLSLLQGIFPAQGLTPGLPHCRWILYQLSHHASSLIYLFLSEVWFFQWSCVDVRVGLWRRLSAEELDAFELWCWRRLLRVPWTARRSNQSILKEISPGCSLEGMMLKLTLQYFGHLMQRTDSLEKTLMLGGIGGRRRGDDRGWDGWMASLTRWTWVWVNSGSWWWTGRPGVLWFMGSQRVGHDWATELNWTVWPFY